MSDLYVGLMSGTSIDGIDIALVDFSKVQPVVVDFFTHDIPDKLTRVLHQLCDSGGNEINILGSADRALAEVSADGVNLMLKRHHLLAADVIAIGSHGQTVRHHPDGRFPFSLQIGDPNTLAVRTGIKVVADFRRKDLALGGQGAPLVPAFHRAIFAEHTGNRVVANIGGIANITFLPAAQDAQVLGFDTGPGNTLMDAWCAQHTQQSYDVSGAWAAGGTHDEKLLEILLGHTYFSLPPPKSTGRELFNVNWLQQQLEQLDHHVPPQSVQTTLAMFTAISLADQIRALPEVKTVVVCGGGVNNDFLMECLESELVECEIIQADDLGIRSDAVEAVAFAWLAYAYMQRLTGNIPSVTGADRAAVLGGLYLPE